MADTVDNKVLFAGTRRYVTKHTSISDGTGESAVVKVDISTLTAPNGGAPTKVVVEEIQWSIVGFSSVRLFWNHDTDDELAILGAGSGYFNFRPVGGTVDPRSAGGDGDIVLTSSNPVAGATYDITLVLRLKD